MKGSLTTIGIVAGLAVLFSWLGFDNSFGSMGALAGSTSTAHLLDNPPNDPLAQKLIGRRRSQIITAFVAFGVGSAVVWGATYVPEKLTQPIQALNFVGWLLIGSAISLFVFKDPADSYAEWSRANLSRSPGDQ